MTDNTVTIELPLTSNRQGVTVDALMTALGHAKAYHDHDEFSWYVNAYDELESEIKSQIDPQIRDMADE